MNQHPGYQQQDQGYNPYGGNQYGGNVQPQQNYYSTQQPLLYQSNNGGNQYQGTLPNYGPRPKRVGPISLIIMLVLFFLGFWPFCLLPLCIPCDE